jgi:hypothetical protein
VREFNSREELIEHYRRVNERMVAAAYVPPPPPEPEPAIDCTANGGDTMCMCVFCRDQPRHDRIDIDALIRDILSELDEDNLPPRARVLRIIARTEARRGLPRGSLARSKNRTRAYVDAKREAIAEAWTTVPVPSKPWLGRIFGLDHTTIVHHLQKLGLDGNRGEKQGNFLMDGGLEKERGCAGNSSSKDQQHVPEDRGQDALSARDLGHVRPGPDLGDDVQ